MRSWVWSRARVRGRPARPWVTCAPHIWARRLEGRVRGRLPSFWRVAHTFSAFWLRSSVVSVLLSLISETEAPLPYENQDDFCSRGPAAVAGACAAPHALRIRTVRGLGIAVPPSCRGRASPSGGWPSPHYRPTAPSTTRPRKHCRTHANCRHLHARQPCLEVPLAAADAVDAGPPAAPFRRPPAVARRAHRRSRLLCLLGRTPSPPAPRPILSAGLRPSQCAPPLAAPPLACRLLPPLSCSSVPTACCSAASPPPLLLPWSPFESLIIIQMDLTGLAEPRAGRAAHAHAAAAESHGPRRSARAPAGCGLAPRPPPPTTPLRARPAAPGTRPSARARARPPTHECPLSARALQVRAQSGAGSGVISPSISEGIIPSRPFG